MNPFLEPCVLVVDDEAALAEMLAEVLASEGHRVFTAGSGEEAQARIKEHPVAVVLTDLRMSPMDGIELLQWIRQHHPAVVVVVMTAYGNMEVVVECLRLGAFDFLSKPIENLDLIGLTVQRALDKHRLHRENEELIARLRAHQQELAAAVREASRKLQRDNMVLSLGAEFTRRVVRSLEFEDILRAADECFSRAPIEWQYSLLLWHPERNHFQMVVNNHPNLEKYAPIVVPPGDSPLMDEVRQTGEVIILETFEGSRYDTGKRDAKYHTPPCMCIPLKVGDELLGVMNINNFSQERFYEIDYQMAIITSEYLTMALKNCRLFTQVREMSERDGLTGLYNHAYFQSLLEKEVRRAERYRLEISLIMLDLDGFKAVNDRYGHLVGNAVLEEFARFLSESVRHGVDVLARYGGDEFAILLPETGLEGARQYAERLRQALARRPFKNLEETDNPYLSSSQGVAAFQPGKSRQQLTLEADQALYESKRGGRNRVSVYAEIRENLQAQGSGG